MTPQDNFSKWFVENPVYLGRGEYFEGDEPPNLPFISILGLERDNLKPFTKDVLERLEDNEELHDLKLGIEAYSQFQDIMGIAIHGENPLWNRHYCYYESLVYLRESVVSWLDKNILAATVLLRPFLELAILHLYWYLRCEAGKNGYDEFYLWLNDKRGKPPFKNQLDYVFANLPSRDVVPSKRTKQIEQLLRNVYKSLSAYNHSPKIEESMISLNGDLSNISFYSFFYYLSTLNILLRQITFLYVLAYPMAIFPVDRYKKWGMEGPLGLYFDFNNVSIITAYVGKDNVSKIRNEMVHLQEVKDRLEWFESLPDITPEEVEAGWLRFVEEGHANVEENDRGHRIAFHKAHSRALGWFTNYLHDLSNPDDEVSDEMLGKVMGKLRNW